MSFPVQEQRRAAQRLMRASALALRMPMIDETPLSDAEVRHGIRFGLIRPMAREDRRKIEGR